MHLTARFVFFLILTLSGLKDSLSVAASSHELSQIFQAGNQFYSQGNFKSAIEEYEKIVKVPIVNETVYYNLANSYFKDNQVGKSILFYEKAVKLAPSDRDIAENLRLARVRIADKVETPQEGFLSRQAGRVFKFFPLDLETLLVVIMFVGANTGFTLFVLGRSPSLSRLALYASIALFALSLLLGVSNVFRIYQTANTREAVILEEKADILSGPANDNPTLFSVHEGLKVRIENELQG